MLNRYVQLTVTNTFKGIVLQQLFLSPISAVVYIVLALPLLYSVLSKQNALPILVYMGAVLFFVHVIKLFNRTVLFSDTLDQGKQQNLVQYLAADITKQLVSYSKLDAETLLQAALDSSRGQFLLEELGMEKDVVIQRVRTQIKNHSVEEILSAAHDLAEKLQEQRIDANVIVYLFFQLGKEFTTLLNEYDLSQDDLRNIMRWEAFHRDWQELMHTWTPSKLTKIFGSFGRGWVAGYTSQLDAFSQEISSDILRDLERDVVIHKEEIEAVLKVLSRKTNANALILGKQGVGKRTLIQNIAYTLRKMEQKSLQSYTRVVVLHTELLLSGTANPDAVLLDALNKAEKAGKFILVIDDLSVLLKSGNQNVVAVLTKFIQSPRIALVAIANTKDYHSIIKTNARLSDMFEAVHVNEATEDEAMIVLMAEYFRRSEKQHVKMSYRILKMVVSLTQRYISQGGMPGTAVSVLDDAVVAAGARGEKTVAEEDVRQAVSLRAHIDVSRMSEGEKELLKTLKDSMAQHVIGQDDALEALTGALKRSRLDIHAAQKPMGTFLFLGPTGVGKTRTAKILAEKYFGASDRFIRLDMNEYSSPDSMQLIVGSSNPGSDHAEGHLTQQVQERPFSLILLDEIEKAHKNVLNAFLQILDEGQMIDSLGVKTDFRNTIIIATSNAGAEFIRTFVRDHEQLDHDEFKKQLVDSILQQGQFSPEFLNRFDEVILYKPLSIEDARRVANILVAEVVDDIQKRKGITVQVQPDALELIVERGHSEEFGARAMRRTVTDILENYLADYFLNTAVKRGDTIRISREDLSN